MTPVPLRAAALALLAAVAPLAPAAAQTAPVQEEAAYRACLRAAVLSLEETGRSPADLAAVAERQCARTRQLDSSRAGAVREEARLWAAKTVVAYRLCKRSAACEVALGR